MSHPFFMLASASKAMRANVEAYCKHLTTTIVNEIGPAGERKMLGKKYGDEEHAIKALQRIAKQEKRAKKLIDEAKTWRMNWINLAWRRCLFCGKATMRRALFHYATWCCRKCDDQHWPKLVCFPAHVSTMHCARTNKAPQRRRDALVKTTLRPIHLDNLDMVFEDATNPTKTFDWSTKMTFYLKCDIKALDECVQEQDPDLRISMAAEEELARQMEQFGLISVTLRQQKSKWRLDPSWRKKFVRRGHIHLHGNSKSDYSKDGCVGKVHKGV